MPRHPPPPQCPHRSMTSGGKFGTTCSLLHSKVEFDCHQVTLSTRPIALAMFGALRELHGIAIVRCHGTHDKRVNQHQQECCALPQCCQRVDLDTRLVREVEHPPPVVMHVAMHVASPAVAPCPAIAKVLPYLCRDIIADRGTERVAPGIRRSPPIVDAVGKWGCSAAKEDTAHARLGTRMSICSSRSVSIRGRVQNTAAAVAAGPVIVLLLPDIGGGGRPAKKCSGGNRRVETVGAPGGPLPEQLPLGPQGGAGGGNRWQPSIRMCWLCCGGICCHRGRMLLQLMELGADVSV